MKVFVTGSTGLLGNNLVRELVARGHRVVGLTRSAAKFERQLGATGATPVVGDLEDIGAFRQAIDGCDAVIHTAAYFREYYEPGGQEAQLQKINVDATLALMREADARGVGRFVHTSSSGAVGHGVDGAAADEDTPPGKRQLENRYFRSKFLGDQEIAAFGPRSGMSIVEILPGWMWGPGDAAPTGAGRILLNMLAGKVPAVPAGGMTVVDARDVAAVMATAMELRELPHDRYLVGGNYHRLMEVLTMCAEAANVPPPKHEVGRGLALAFAHLDWWWSRLTGAEPKASVEGIRAVTANHRIGSARAVRDLGARFRPFRETARDTVGWYRAHGYLDFLGGVDGTPAGEGAPG